MTTIRSLVVSFEVVECGVCGGVYALTVDYIRIKREKSGFWNCPYCKCSWGFPANGSEVAQLKRKLEYREADLERERKRLAEERERHKTTTHRLSATKAVVTKTKKRIANGVCPCCNRTFNDLQQHIRSKHPNYGDEK